MYPGSAQNSAFSILGIGTWLSIFFSRIFAIATIRAIIFALIWTLSFILICLAIYILMKLLKKFYPQSVPKTQELINKVTGSDAPINFEFRNVLNALCDYIFYFYVVQSIFIVK